MAVAQRRLIVARCVDICEGEVIDMDIRRLMYGKSYRDMTAVEKLRVRIYDIKVYLKVEVSTLLMRISEKLDI